MARTTGIPFIPTPGPTARRTPGRQRLIGSMGALLLMLILVGHGLLPPAAAATPPFAHAGPDQAVALGEQVILDGSGSTDVDGHALTYQWTLVEEPAGSAATLDEATAVQPRFYANVAGRYIAQLIVTDAEGLSSAADQVTVSVEENAPPVAHISGPMLVTVDETVSLDGSRSTDIDGDALTYRWTVTARPEGSHARLVEATAVRPTLSIDQPGDYQVSLLVHDGQADSRGATVAFTTDRTTNLPPVAVAQVTAPLGAALEVGDTVTFTGAASFDPDEANATLTYAWSLLTRPLDSTAVLSGSTTATPSFDVDILGDYVVQLVVMDADGAASAPVTTLVSRNRRPVAHAGSSRTTIIGQEVFLDGTGSADPDGAALTYQWSLLSQPAGPDEEGPVALPAPHTAQPSWTPSVVGTYVIQLMVHDGTFRSHPRTVTVWGQEPVDEESIALASGRNSSSQPTQSATISTSSSDTTITVTDAGLTLADDGQCTLPEAIIAANDNTASGASPGECAARTAGVDTIVFANDVGDIALTTVADTTVGFTGLPAITSEMIIAGGGRTIHRDADLGCRFNQNEFRILYIAATGNLTLRGTTISQGCMRSRRGGMSPRAAAFTITGEASRSSGVRSLGMWPRGTVGAFFKLPGGSYSFSPVRFQAINP